MNITRLSSQLQLAGGRVWLGCVHAFSMVGGRKRLHESTQGCWGWIKRSWARCWAKCCTLAPWDGDGSGPSPEGIRGEVGGLQPHARHPLGAVLGVPVASQPFTKINPLALSGKSLTLAHGAILIFPLSCWKLWLSWLVTDKLLDCHTSAKLMQWSHIS